MKRLFPGYFKPSEEEYADIWANALIVPDTNVLLNLYRYSEKTSDEFLSVLERYSASLWLPHRVAEEFLGKRATVISGQVKKLQEIVERARKLHSEINPRNQHPLIDSGTACQFDRITEEIVAQLERNSEKQRSLISSDSVLARIAAIFEDEKIGEPYDATALEEIIKEGVQRYAEKIPPGYMDSDKVQSPDQSSKQGKSNKKEGDLEVAAVSFEERCRPFGDLIIWMEVLKKAGEAQRPIIFITGDAKDDWWEIRSNITIGPRPELVKEFQEKSGKKIVFYSPERFLTFSKAARNEVVTDAAISEVKEVSEQAVKAKETAANLEARSDGSDEEERFIASRLNDLSYRKRYYQDKIDGLGAELSRIDATLRSAEVSGELEDFEIELHEQRKKKVLSAGLSIMNKINRIDSELFNINLDRNMRGPGSRP